MASPSKLGNILKYMDKVTGGIKPKAWLFKFVPLVLIQACSVFAYTILKNTKNSVVNRVSPDGTFAWLKLLVITPLALSFPIFLKKIIDLLKDRKEKIPYVLIGLFLALYTSFALIIFPFGDVLQLTWLPQWLTTFQVGGFKVFGFLPSSALKCLGFTFGYWGNSLFYGFSEFWSVIGINFLAWGIANDICSENESRIFYPSFGILSNIGGYLAARIMSGSDLSNLTGDVFLSTLQRIIFTASAAIFLMGLTYFFIERFVIKDPKMIEARKETKKKSKPENGFQLVARNAYLQKIAIMVVGYALVIFLVEQCWYSSINNTYGKVAYTAVTAKVAEINSLMTIGLSLFSTFVLTSFPWAVRAMIPVIMIGFSAVGFFTFYILGKSATAVGFLASSGLMSVMPIQLAVIVGSFQNISARCTKYSIFDSTKEQLFSSSPDSDVRLQGKGAIDVAFGRVAKSGGALIIIGLLSLHSLYVSFTRQWFSRSEEQQTEQVVHIQKQVNSKELALEIGRQAFKVETDSEGRLVVKFKDITSIEHKDFDKVVGSDGSISFVQKKQSPVVAETIAQPPKQEAAEQPESTNLDIAPIIFVIVLIVVALWSYAVVTIAPMHEMNLIEARRRNDPDSVKDGDIIIENPFNKRTVLQLLIIASVLCTGLYLWVSREIGKVVARFESKAQTETSVTIKKE